MQLNLHLDFQFCTGRCGFSLTALAPILLSCVVLQSGPAVGQQVWPNIHDTSGPTIDIETEDNVRCRYSSGAKPSFSLAGLSSNPYSNQQINVGSTIGNNGSSQLGGGLLLTIPFGGPQVEGCGRLSALQEQRSKLALGAALLEQGLINQEQFQSLGASIARELGIPASSSTAMPAKPVYEPPPPLKLSPVSTQRSIRSPAKQSSPPPRPAPERALPRP
jgi:hypothetical protein